MDRRCKQIFDKRFPNNDSKLLQCVDRVNQGVNRFTVDRVKDHFEEALGNKNSTGAGKKASNGFGEIA